MKEKKENKWVFSELVDTVEVQKLMDLFYELNKSAAAIVDVDNTILVATGWQDLCTKFHRVCPETRENCFESENYISKHLTEGKYIEYKCKNGLWDFAYPIIIEGHHLATILMGQFFYEGEEIDRDFFIKQAEKYGFDKKRYLQALDRVPQVSRETVRKIMDWNVKLANILSKQGLANLKLSQAMESLQTEITERRQTEEALWAAEQNFRNSLDSSPLGTRIINAAGETIYANQAILDIYGYSSIEELKATPIRKRYTLESYAEQQERAEKRKLGKPVPTHFEVSIIRKDGEVRHLEVFHKEILWSGKTQFQVVYHDITDRKQAGEKLRKSEEKYRTLTENVNVGVYRVTPGPKGEFIEVNPAFVKILGYKNKKEVLSINVADIYQNPKDRKKFSEKLTREGLVRGEELQLKKKDGTPLIASASDVAVKDEKGRVQHWDCIVEDITERKQAEENLRESEQTYRALVNLGAEVGEAIVMFQDTEQEEGIQTFVNDEWPHTTGYSKEELLGMSFFDLLHPKYRENSIGRHRRKISGENVPGLFEMSIIRKDGAEVPIELTSAYTTYQGKRANVAYIRDITERKKMQEQLIVTDRLASIGELSSGIAHELNNPLTGVIGFSDLLLQKDVSDDVKEDLEVINREAKRTAGVVRNLLTFARKHETEKKPVNINSIIEKVLELRAYEQKVSNIEVNTQFASDVPEIMADGFRLQQVFINIIINAEHFMTEAHGRGTLTITTERVGNIIRASFADDGPGIAKENLSHMFDPFFTTKEVGKGTGLGLSICHGIITEHGGRIYAESELGKGATFVIELPISTTDNEGTINENS